MAKTNKPEGIEIAKDFFSKIQSLKKEDIKLETNLLNRGKLAEIECCYEMNWKWIPAYGNPGFDAINKKEKVQIKAFYEGQKSSMIGRSNPDKVKSFDTIVLAIFDKEMKLKNIYKAKKENYRKKLIEHGKINNKRYDLSRKQFMEIYGIKKIFSVGQDF